MVERTRPIAVRLASRDIEQLQARAHSLSAPLSGVTRNLIRTGLAGGDNKALADQLMLVERRLVALEQLARGMDARVQTIDRAARDLLAMFDALLKALTGDHQGRVA